MVLPVLPMQYTTLQEVGFQSGIHADTEFWKGPFKAYENLVYLDSRACIVEEVGKFNCEGLIALQQPAIEAAERLRRRRS